MPIPNPNSQRARGTSINPSNRFEEIDSIRDEDWDQADERVKTIFLRDDSKTVLSKNTNPSVNFNFALNPYRGCEHGCIYCYARTYHEYLGYSAGLDFESRIFVKENAAELLAKEFWKKRWEPQKISFSGVTDAYQPIERKLEITRACLKVCADFRNPVSILTKNALVTRDLDHLRALNRVGAVAVTFSVTSLDSELTRVLEPRTSTPASKLKAMRELSAAGIPVGVMIGPVIPGLNEHEIPEILAAAAEAGASFASYTVIRLGFGLPELFEGWLDEHYPNRKESVLKGVRSLNGGEFYNFNAKGMRGEGEAAERIRFVFKVALERSGIPQASPELATEHFRVPSPQRQLFS